MIGRRFRMIQTQLKKQSYRCIFDTAGTSTGVVFAPLSMKNRATGVVFDTCRPVFEVPQVSFLHHTYISHALSNVFREQRA